MPSKCTELIQQENGYTLIIHTVRNGQKLKISRTSQSAQMIEKFKRIHNREIIKFGDFKNFSLKESDNIVVKLSLDLKESEKANKEMLKNKLKDAGSIKCRFCGGEHYSMKCPNKEL